MVHHDGLSEKNPFPFKGRPDPGGRKNKTHAGGTFIFLYTIQHIMYNIQQVDRQCNDDTSHKITCFYFKDDTWYSKEKLYKDHVEEVKKIPYKKLSKYSYCLTTLRI